MADVDAMTTFTVRVVGHDRSGPARVYQGGYLVDDRAAFEPRPLILFVSESTKVALEIVEGLVGQVLRRLRSRGRERWLGLPSLVLEPVCVPLPQGLELDIKLGQGLVEGVQLPQERLGKDIALDEDDVVIIAAELIA
ncbi:MAG: hypothetical protein QF464_19330, partial [Myxococcota bacterium]|nr:hypothetical protein [Myxococcota bacterium]